MCRGVTRLDGAWGKKQIWRTHVRTTGLSKANVLFWKIAYDITVTFGPPSDSAPGELCPHLYPLLHGRIFHYSNYIIIFLSKILKSQAFSSVQTWAENRSRICIFTFSSLYVLSHESQKPGNASAYCHQQLLLAQCDNKAKMKSHSRLEYSLVLQLGGCGTNFITCGSVLGLLPRS